MRISSTRNPVVALFRSLERSSGRREHGAYMVEGVRLVAEALAARREALIALYDPALLRRSAAGLSLLEALPGWSRRAYETDARILAAASNTETPAGVVVALRHDAPAALPMSSQPGFGLILDGVADPGNAGTILRTADAVGVQYVMTSPGSVDLFAPKVVRAGMGAHFRVPILERQPWERIAEQVAPRPLIASSAGAAVSMYDFAWPPSGALVIGSEAHGVSRDVEALVTQTVRIPMRPGVESLNAGTAASVLLYQILGSRLL